ncbi:isoprenyl transferase [Aliidongia dinghuensis]|uniref:Isoprenyl transferase n=1 Tax=Aliidongia dinghuensis TaxID=1867774 RepID=A0A8J3E7G7_9PROT|nr:isoprenyl transferase [Aliidongia dinghuensis]
MSMDGLPLSPAPPAHVAIIMDGNGRWAKARGMPRLVGHKRGVESVRDAVKAAKALGIRYLTLYGFSSENWRRPLAEVNDLMGLLRLYLRSEIAELHREGVRLRIIGQRSRLSDDIRALIENGERLTADNANLTLTIALSYGGRDEIAHAAKAIAMAVRAGTLDPEEVDEETVSRHLFTHDMPDPDLLIRTSGEKRVSNFLLWQCAYAELVFIDKHWPDFSRDDLESAIREYHGRERRFGASAGSSR